MSPVATVGVFLTALSVGLVPGYRTVVNKVVAVDIINIAVAVIINAVTVSLV